MTAFCMLYIEYVLHRRTRVCRDDLVCVILYRTYVFVVYGMCVILQLKSDKIRNGNHDLQA